MIDPTAEAARDRALQRFQAGDYRAAAEMLSPLLATHPGDALLHRLHGMALVRTGLAGQGVPFLARSALLAPDDAVCATWHGIGLHAAGRYEDAVRALAIATALAPQDPAPLVHAARALLQSGRSIDALRAAERASALAPRLSEARHAERLAALAVLQADPAASPAALCEAWLGLGQVCQRLDRIEDARAAFNEALRAQPAHPAAQCALALIDHLCGQPISATTRLRAVLEQDPGCDLARLGLASRLLLGGDAADALALLDEREPPGTDDLRAQWHLERAQALIALNRDGEAEHELARVARYALPELELVFCWQHLVLASRRRRPDAPRLVERAARLADTREAGSTEQRIDAHFDLAELHHKASRRGAAFAHWSRGHALLGLAQPFSRPEHARYLDTIRRSFDAERLRHGPRADGADPTPVFIVGLPRTGTTLLEQILSAHPAVHGAGERLAAREMMVRLAGTTAAGDATAACAALDAASLSAASAVFLDDLRALAPAASRVLDKMPDNIYQLGFLATLLPGARVICCTRDLRDVGFSIFKHRFLGHHPYAHDLADLGWFMAAQQNLLMHWRSCLPTPMLIVDHADWIADFDATLRRVLGFLDLSFDPACERFFEQDRRIGSASRAQVRRPINADGVGRWRDYAEQLQPMLRALEADRPG